MEPQACWNAPGCSLSAIVTYPEDEVYEEPLTDPLAIKEELIEELSLRHELESDVKSLVECDPLGLTFKLGPENESTGQSASVKVEPMSPRGPLVSSAVINNNSDQSVHRSESRQLQDSTPSSLDTHLIAKHKLKKCSEIVKRLISRVLPSGSVSLSQENTGEPCNILTSSDTDPATTNTTPSLQPNNMDEDDFKIGATFDDYVEEELLAEGQTKPKTQLINNKDDILALTVRVLSVNSDSSNKVKLHKAATISTHGDQSSKSYSSVNKLIIEPYANECTFKCEECSSSFSTKVQLKSHIMKMHRSERDYKCLPDRTSHQCDVCLKSCKTAGFLQRHSKSHVKKTLLKCGVCERGFKCDSKLKIHMRTHTGERPFQCTVCDKQFRQGIGLNMHIRTQACELQLHCTICNMQFNEGSSLKMHMNTHTGEQPFQSTDCNMHFTLGSRVSEPVTVHVEQRSDPLDLECMILPDNESMYESVAVDVEHESDPLEMTFKLEQEYEYVFESVSVKVEPMSPRSPPLFPTVSNNISDQSVHRSESQRLQDSTPSSLDTHLIAKHKLKKCSVIVKRLNCRVNPSGSVSQLQENKSEPCNVSTSSITYPAPENSALFFQPNTVGKDKEDMTTDAIFDSEVEGKLLEESQSKSCTLPIKNKPDILALTVRVPSVNSDSISNKIKLHKTATISTHGDQSSKSCSSVNKLIIEPHANECTFKCEVCSTSFSSEVQLQSHIMKLHQSERDYKCRQDRTHQCDICLKNDCKSRVEEEMLNCAVCKNGFKHNSELKSHMLTHTGERPYQCTICGEQFSYCINMTIHMRFHAGERPYQCTTCPKLFSKCSNLTEHMRTYTGEWPYHCTICDKQFSNCSNLTLHMRIHAERPFHCTVCNKKFNEGGNLKRHMGLHTDELIKFINEMNSKVQMITYADEQPV